MHKLTPRVDRCQEQPGASVNQLKILSFEIDELSRSGAATQHSGRVGGQLCVPVSEFMDRSVKTRSNNSHYFEELSWPTPSPCLFHRSLADSISWQVYLPYAGRFHRDRDLRVLRQTVSN